MSRELIVSIDSLGNTKIDAVGFTGKSCEAATEHYIANLSSKDVSDVKKPEYMQQNTSGVTAGRRGW